MPPALQEVTGLASAANSERLRADANRGLLSDRRHRPELPARGILAAFGGVSRSPRIRRSRVGVVAEIRPSGGSLALGRISAGTTCGTPYPCPGGGQFGLSFTSNRTTKRSPSRRRTRKLAECEVLAVDSANK